MLCIRFEYHINDFFGNIFLKNECLRSHSFVMLKLEEQRIKPTEIWLKIYLEYFLKMHYSEVIWNLFFGVKWTC